MTHVDDPQIKGDGWIVLLSIGADIEYGFRAARGGPMSTTRVRSAACFNGKVVWHEVTRVDANVPEFWSRLVPDGSYDRIGLQMRCNGDNQYNLMNGVLQGAQRQNPPSESEPSCDTL